MEQAFRSTVPYHCLFHYFLDIHRPNIYFIKHLLYQDKVEDTCQRFEIPLNLKTIKQVTAKKNS